MISNTYAKAGLHKRVVLAFVRLTWGAGRATKTITRTLISGVFRGTREMWTSLGNMPAPDWSDGLAMLLIRLRFRTEPYKCLEHWTLTRPTWHLPNRLFRKIA